MIIGGLDKLSLLDYPNKVAAVVFTQGCNFRCHFCYNPMLVWPLQESDGSEYKEKDHSLISEEDLFLFLESRKGKLDGVVVSGGEPTLHKDLPDFLAKIKAMGFLVKLDSNGTNPEMLAQLIDQELVDYIAMDLKGHRENYQKVVGRPVEFSKIEKSVKIVMSSGIPYEFRTTVVPGLHKKEDFLLMGKIIEGAQAWNIQKFKSQTDLVNQEFEGQKPFSPEKMKEIHEIVRSFVKNSVLR